MVDLFFGSLILVGIICWGLVWYEEHKEKEALKNKVRTPPSREVLDFGCHPTNVFCGYQEASIEEMNGTNIKISKNELYCHYIKGCVKIGSKCPYAQAHPDKLSKPFWE